jgi:hypothetical protein
MEVIYVYVSYRLYLWKIGQKVFVELIITLYCSLLGYDAVQSDTWLPVFLRMVCPCKILVNSDQTTQCHNLETRHLFFSAVN